MIIKLGFHSEVTYIKFELQLRVKTKESLEEQE